MDTSARALTLQLIKTSYVESAEWIWRGAVSADGWACVGPDIQDSTTDRYCRAESSASVIQNDEALDGTILSASRIAIHGQTPGNHEGPTSLRRTLTSLRPESYPSSNSLRKRVWCIRSLLNLGHTVCRGGDFMLYCSARHGLQIANRGHLWRFTLNPTDESYVD